MKASEEIPQLLLGKGWMELRAEPSGVTFFRWLPRLRRQELNVRFDALGRVAAWSIWMNERVTLDQDPGNRKRLTDAIKDAS